MKKKLLICSRGMEIGGVERALLGLLYSIDYTKYDVDLYLCSHTGEFMSLLPKQVNLLPEDKKAAAITLPCKKVIKKGYFDIVGGRMVAKVKTALYLKKHNIGENCLAVEYSNKYTYRFVRAINPDVTYDLLLSFSEPHYIAAYKARAHKRIAWIHTDYGVVAVDRTEAYRVWNKFDAIAAVSGSCLKEFGKIFPKLKDKLFLMENIIYPELIQKQAKAFSCEKEMPLDGSIRILSIGRFCNAKNFESIPEICSLLIKKGIAIKWYLIGYGGNEQLIREKIIQYKMEKNVIILGKKSNPYPYIEACDFYIQPSKYEGKAVSVIEAQCLHKVVIITDYPTSSSQIVSGYNGIIVPLNTLECARQISQIIEDKELQAHIINNLKQENFGNKAEIEKIYEYLSDEI